MSPKEIMVIAGEPSGDLLAAELVQALKRELEAKPHSAFRTPHFFGAGGPRMAAAGIELAFDMTQHAVVGLIEVLKNYTKFKRLFNQLLQLAVNRKPDAIICVDFSGFNRRFAAAVRRYERNHGELKWHPKIVQYVSPQVWASRPKRAEKMARDIDLVLTIFPFEKDWYARRVPSLRVEFVGHPMVERYRNAECGMRKAELVSPSFPTRTEQDVAGPAERVPNVLLLPGSRVGELKRHLPVMREALARIRSAQPNIRSQMVLPNEALARLARTFSAPTGVEMRIGNLPDALAQATVAIASTGTVTLECAYFGVPTVAIYKTSWSTYWIGRSIIQVKYLAMPNLLADEALFPEFIQQAATAKNVARAALELIRDEHRRRAIRSKLAQVVISLGEVGASGRAASAIIRLLSEQ